MKSDKEKLIELLTSFGVEFSETDNGKIEMIAGDEKIVGYMGFYTSFDFCEDGEFEKVGAWE